LKYTDSRGIKFPKIQNDSIKIECYSDADLGGPELNPKSLDPKPNCCSISGYLVLVNGGPVIFRLRHQHQIASSSTQSEILAV
jgi:hypothetical protein